MHVRLKENLNEIEIGCLIVTDADTYMVMPCMSKRERYDYALQLISLQCQGVYEQRFRTTNDIVCYIQEELQEVIKRVVKRSCVKIVEVDEL